MFFTDKPRIDGIKGLVIIGLLKEDFGAVGMICTGIAVPRKGFLKA